jgi:hypothetical protein
MADYMIARVSSKPPREWSFTDKKTGAKVDMETYNVMLEGENDPVEVNRKPGDRPAIGEVLSGRLEDTGYGKRFKRESKPYTPGAGKSYQPKDEAAIKAMWSISQAVAFLGLHPKEAVLTDVEPLARDLFGMVDRVKTGQVSGYEKAAATAQQIKQKAVDTAWGGQTQEVNLEEIPF